MAKTDANPPMPDFVTDYELQEVDPSFLTSAVKPKQFLHIDQAECILCEGCVDICPWKCIHMVSVDAIADATDTEQPGEDPTDNVAFIVDEDVCTRCAVRGSVPDGRDHPRQALPTDRRRRPPHPHRPPRLLLRREVLSPTDGPDYYFTRRDMRRSASGLPPV